MDDINKLIEILKNFEQEHRDLDTHSASRKKYCRFFTNSKVKKKKINSKR